MTNQATTQPAPANDGTRDLFLSYNSRDREAVLRVWQLLETRAVSTFLDRNDLTPGLPWQAELEAALAKVNAVAVFIGSEGIGAWQRPEKELALNRQQQAQHAGRRFPVIPVLLPDADANKVTGFLSLNTWIDLRNGLDHPATPAAIDALARAVKGELPAAQTPPPEPLCPYRGLEPFHEDDAALFFGREEFAEALMQKVLAQPLVAVVGPSGSGKSSVVQAGLLPRLRRACWPNQTWEAIVFTPREQPFHSLAKELLPLYEPALDKTERMMAARKLGEALAAGEIPLSDPIAEALKTVERANRLLLVVDQFEELFTLSEERYRQPFVEALIATATRADSPVTVVLTLRADFYGQAIGLSRALSDGIQQGLVNLGPMTKDELWQAIVKPAESVGLRFEPGLVERLLVDVLGQPGSLPLLEFALKELWQRRRNGMIVNDQYDEIGKLEGAISQRADAQFERVPSAERETVLRAFTRLVRVSAANEEGTDTRQRVRLKDLDAAVHPVVKSFVKERLLVMSRVEETSEETVEVAHEALIRRWERLKELLNKDRQFFLWRQRLGLMLGEWQRTKRDAGALLRGAPLNEAKRWLKDRGKDLNQQEREFIRQSELAVPKPLRRIAAAAAGVLIVALAAFGWKLWDDRDESQINKIIIRSPDLVKPAASDVSNFNSVEAWLQTLVLTGQPDEALKAVQPIAVTAARSRAQLCIVRSLARAGLNERAMELTQAIDDAFICSQAKIAVVEELVKAGRAEAAKQATNQMLDAARRSESIRGRSEAMVGAVGALAKIGEFEEALAGVEEIENGFSRFFALSLVVEGLSAAGKNDKARQITNQMLEAAQRIEDINMKYLTMSAIVGTLARIGENEQAKQIANQMFESAQQIKDIASRSSAVAHASEALTWANRDYRKPEQKIEDLYYSQSAGEVETLVKAGRNDAALEAARKINDVFFRSRALVSVTESLAKSSGASKARGVLAEARRLALQVPNDVQKSQAMARVATGLAKLHDYRLARQTADLCPRSSDTLSAYAAILREYYVEQHPDQAKLFEEGPEKEK